MNTGQMLLALGALIFLSTIILRFNRAELKSDEVMYNSKFNVLASSLCTSLIEEAKGKAFDNNTDSAAVNSVSLLSSKLGPETGENSSDDFNDFDDFNGYVRTDSTMPSAVFYVTSKVTYIDGSDLNKVSTTQTWRKAITVTVMSSSMSNPVEMSSIYAYWYTK